MEDEFKGFAPEICKILYGKYAHNFICLKPLSLKGNYRKGEIWF